MWDTIRLENKISTLEHEIDLLSRIMYLCHIPSSDSDKYFRSEDNGDIHITLFDEWKNWKKLFMKYALSTDLNVSVILYGSYNDTYLKALKLFCMNDIDVSIIKTDKEKKMQRPSWFIRLRKNAELSGVFVPLGSVYDLIGLISDDYIFGIRYNKRVACFEDFDMEEVCPWPLKRNNLLSHCENKLYFREYIHYGQECAICQDIITARDACKVDCRHVFHASCLAKWISRCLDYGLAKTCPLCRNDCDQYMLDIRDCRENRVYELEDTLGVEYEVLKLHKCSYFERMKGKYLDEVSHKRMRI